MLVVKRVSFFAALFFALDLSWVLAGLWPRTVVMISILLYALALGSVNPWRAVAAIFTALGVLQMSAILIIGSFLNDPAPLDNQDVFLAFAFTAFPWVLGLAAGALTELFCGPGWSERLWLGTAKLLHTPAH